MGSVLRVGLAGLGTVSAQILPAFAATPGVALAAAADTRKEARDAFAAAFHLPTYETIEALCRAPDIDAIWVATPNPLHCAHSIAAAENGKHVICEKPLALTLDECDRMIEAAERAGVQLLQAHSKIMDSPIRAMGALIAGGTLGRVIQIQSLNYNDWLQRPRLPAELDTARGGGVVFRQAPHLVEIVRFLGGGMARSVRAMAGRWDPHFDTEGNFLALVDFAEGAAASIGFSGYGYFDSVELVWNIGVYGKEKPDPRAKRGARRQAALTEAEKYGRLPSPAADTPPEKKRMPFFGLTIVSCERGVIRQSPDGLYVYTDSGRAEIAVPPNPERAAELIELRDALAEKRTVFPDGRWGRATLELCLRILDSSERRGEIALTRQVPVPADWAG